MARDPSPDMTTVLQVWPYAGFIKKRNLRRMKLQRKNHGSTPLGSSLSNRDNARAQAQFRREEETQQLKRWVFFQEQVHPLSHQ